MNTQTKFVLAKDLKVGDSLQFEDDVWRKITSIGKGFFNKSKLIHYTDGRWNCLLDSDKVEAIISEEIHAEQYN